MHSRIFQLTQTQLDPAVFLDAYSLDYDHWFFHSVASYAEKDEDRTGSVHWLKACIALDNPHIVWRDDSFVLREGFLTRYFAKRYESYKRQLAILLEEATIEAFVRGDIGKALSELSEFEEEETGFYVYNELGDIITLDSFLRNAELDTPYYIGGTVDYHC